MVFAHTRLLGAQAGEDKLSVSGNAVQLAKEFHRLLR
jgi:hypothetical protein